MPTIRLEAVDTLFFRDGRPFTMGEDTFATGIFPPPPSVIFGALRSAYASENNVVLEDIQASTSHIKIHGLNYGFGGDLYYPIPLDLVKIKNENGIAKLLRVSPNSGLISNKMKSFNYFLWRPNHIESITNGFLDAYYFKQYLSGNLLEEWKFKTIDDFTITEVKLGIGRSNQTKQSEDGKLYRLGMRRLQPVNSQGRNCFSFVIETNENTYTSLGKLGGEAKGVRIEAINIDSSLNIDYSEEIYFKIYLQTPAFFKNGVLPDLKLFFPDWEFEILTYVVGKPLHIGGFDMKTNLPKPMLKAVPAGSVYYVKINKGGNLRQLVNYVLNNKIQSLSDTRTEEGFGLFYFANLPFNKVTKKFEI
jgi:CRISPR-associated protein Cmr3